MGTRGQAETIGLVLLLAITVAGVAATVAIAGSALEGAEQSTSVQRAEQSLSLLDARAALVALGQTDGQTVDLSGSNGGEYRVDPDAGRMTVIRQDSDGDQVGSPIVNTTLGALVYENGDSRVAFQGGGVWRTSGRGAEMVSPPEFNYQDATLTLPVIRVTGGEATFSGSPSARVELNPAATNLSKFPSATRQNPLENGTAVVSVESEYYRGWETYFRERSTGNVSVYPEEQRVELELIARGEGGAYSLGESPIELRGLGEGQPVQSLSFELHPNKNSNFNDLDWALVADDGGSDRFEVAIGGGNPCKGDQNDVTVTYENGGTTHVWENTSAWRESGSSFTYSCSGAGDNEPTLEFDLTGDTNLTYQGGPSPLSNDSVGYVVNHYLGEMGPNLDLKVTSKGKNNPPGNSGSTNLEMSTVDVEYNSSSDRVLTFLHVTENSVNVTFT